MFWNNVAGIYDVFVNVINRKTHLKLKRIVAELIEPKDNVLECACGTGIVDTSLPLDVDIISQVYKLCQLFILCYTRWSKHQTVVA